MLRGHAPPRVGKRAAVVVAATPHPALLDPAQGTLGRSGAARRRWRGDVVVAARRRGGHPVRGHRHRGRPRPIPTRRSDGGGGQQRPRTLGIRRRAPELSLRSAARRESQRARDMQTSGRGSSLRTLADRPVRARARTSGGAPGAVVLTGDDDQAPLDCYAEQLASSGTRRSRISSIRSQAHARNGAIDASAAGHRPRLASRRAGRADRVRPTVQRAGSLVSIDHRPPGRVGAQPRFPERGYWGHLTAWLAEGIAVISATFQASTARC